MSAVAELLERARRNLDAATAALSLAERLSAITLACASESPRAAALAVRAATKVPPARDRLVFAQRDLESCEREAERIERVDRMAREHAAAPPLSDEERLQLQSLRPERRIGHGVATIPGVPIDVLLDAERQAEVDRSGAFVERPATGARAHAIRLLLKLFQSKFKDTQEGLST
jgi:hypothetical protein